MNQPSRFLRAPPRRLLTNTHSRPFFLHCREATKHNQVPDVLSTYLAADRLRTVTFGLLGTAAQTCSLHRTCLIRLPPFDSVSIPTAQRLPPACGFMVGAGIQVSVRWLSTVASGGRFRVGLRDSRLRDRHRRGVPLGIRVWLIAFHEVHWRLKCCPELLDDANEEVHEMSTITYHVIILRRG